MPDFSRRGFLSASVASVVGSSILLVSKDVPTAEGIIMPDTDIELIQKVERPAVVGDMVFLAYPDNQGGLDFRPIGFLTEINIHRDYHDFTPLGSSERQYMPSSHYVGEGRIVLSSEGIRTARDVMRGMSRVVRG